MKPTLVAWCAQCQHYLPLEDAGTRCPSLDCPRTLRKRRVWICATCDGTEDAYLSRAGYDADQQRHRKGEAAWNTWRDAHPGVTLEVVT